MPASQTVDYPNEGYLELEIEPVEESNTIYFTDQAPKFRLTAWNKSERTITSRNDAVLKWVLRAGSGIDKVIAEGFVDFCLEPGETHVEIIEPGLLGFEESAILGVTSCIRRENMEDDTKPFKLDPTNGSSIDQILYTFTIWDRSHYEVAHEQPKKLQKAVILFGGLTATLALIQAAIALASNM